MVTWQERQGSKSRGRWTARRMPSDPCGPIFLTPRLRRSTWSCWKASWCRERCSVCCGPWLRRTTRTPSRASIHTFRSRGTRTRTLPTRWLSTPVRCGWRSPREVACSEHHGTHSSSVGYVTSPSTSTSSNRHNDFTRVPHRCPRTGSVSTPRPALRQPPRHPEDGPRQRHSKRH